MKSDGDVGAQAVQLEMERDSDRDGPLPLDLLAVTVDANYVLTDQLVPLQQPG